jgi:uncharacterized membrane protein (DUF106 family)
MSLALAAAFLRLILLILSSLTHDQERMSEFMRTRAEYECKEKQRKR